MSNEETSHTEELETTVATETVATENEGETQEHTSETDMFPRRVVEKLRSEAAAARVKAKEADSLRRELFHARVQVDGRLIDPADLPYSEELLADGDALTGAIDELLARKPYLAKRPIGDIGAGARGDAATPANLVTLIRNLQDNGA